MGTGTGARGEALRAQIEALRASADDGQTGARRLALREQRLALMDAHARVLTGMGEGESVEMAAGAVAGQRARFAALGSAALHVGGERVTRSHARAARLAGEPLSADVTTHADGRPVGPDTLSLRDGSGHEVDRQAVREMTLAARAALLGGFAGLPPGMAAANRAAASELHHSTREALYGDADEAARAADRAWRLAAEQWDSEEPAEAVTQPHRAECVATDAEQWLGWRAVLRRAARRAARAVRAYWEAGGLTGQRLRGLRSDRRALAGLLWDIRRGEASAPTKEADRATWERLARLGRRLEAGAELLTPPVVAVPAVAPTIRAARAVETWEARTPRDPVPPSAWVRTAYAERLVARASAGEAVESLREWRPRMA